MEEISNFMEESIVNVDAKSSVREAAQLMRDRGVSALLVGSNESYSGILTKVDLVRKVVAVGVDPSSSTVRSAETKPLITIESNLPMIDAYDRMREHNIRHLVVVENSRIVGMLSIKDFANYYHNMFCDGANEAGEIRYFMKDAFHSIEPQATVFAAAQKMAEHNVGALLIGNQKEYEGLLTEVHITVDVIAEGRDPKTTKISSIKTQPIFSVDCDQPMETAYQSMRSNNIRHVAITEKNKIVGLLSIKDFANYYNFKFCRVIDETDRIRHSMEENLLEIDLNATIRQAGEIMRRYNVGSLFVKEGSEIVGIVTERDFAQKAIAEGLDVDKVKVSVLLKEPVVLDENLPMDEALSCMRKNNVRYIAATRENKIVGVISIKDLAIYYKHKFVFELDFGESI